MSKSIRYNPDDDYGQDFRRKKRRLTRDEKRAKRAMRQREEIEFERDDRRDD